MAGIWEDDTLDAGEVETNGAMADGVAEGSPAEVQTAVEEDARDTQARLCLNETVVSTACGHVFHFGCLSHWLHQCTMGIRPTTCPLCQATIDVDIVFMPWLLLRGRQKTAGGGDVSDDDGEVCRLLSTTCMSPICPALLNRNCSTV
jgi:hypothetical protein